MIGSRLRPMIGSRLLPMVGSRLLTLLALLPMLACEGPTVPPNTPADIYDFRLQTTPPEVLRWPSGSRIAVHAADVAGSRAGVLANGLAGGAAIWNRHALYGEYELETVSSVRAADVLLQWSDEPSLVDMTDCPSVVAIAVTTFCRAADDDARLHVFPLLPPVDDSSVRFVITILGTLATDTVAVEKLIIHELGHALGIGQHSPNPQDMMAQGLPVRRTLSLRDIATIQVLYHTRPHMTP